MKEKKIARQQQKTRPANQPQNVLPWRSLEQQVVRAQKQIAQAALRSDRQAVYDLQQRLMESEAARLLAVRRVAGETPRYCAASFTVRYPLSCLDISPRSTRINLPRGWTSCSKVP